MDHDLSFLEKSNLSWLESNTIFLTVVGSQSYGLNTKDSDTDYKGLCIPPKEYYISFLNKFEQAEFKKPNPDCCIFNLVKWMKLAVDNNPSVIEILWTDPEHYVLTSSYWDKIIQHREKILSKNIRFRFGGYAFSQLKKMNRHYRYLKNPPQAPPTRKEFGLPEEYKLPKDQLDAALSLIQKKLDCWNFNINGLDDSERIELKNTITEVMVDIIGSSLYYEKENLWREAAISLGFECNFIELIQKEKEYKQKKEDWKHYQEWKLHRNTKRAEVESKVGYDAKDATSLIRLLRMAKEILTTGEVLVKRPDREELLAIKQGVWTYEQIVEYAEKANIELDELYKITKLPKEPDRVFFDKLCQEIIEEYLEM
jgi:predicted nucleotidyltransferase